MLFVVLAGACTSTGGDAFSIEGGPLVAIAEGEHLELAVSTQDPIDVHSPDGASWIHVSGQTLVLDPPCDLVPGPTAAPKRFEVEVVAGHRSTMMQIQVRGSIAGRCTPVVYSCVFSGTATCANAPACVAGNSVSPLVVDFATDPDLAIVFAMTNPDPADALSLSATMPSTIGAFVNGCFHARDVGVLGQFRIPYEVTRGSDALTAETVVSGSRPVKWNVGSGSPLGIELGWCSTVGGACVVQATGAASISKSPGAEALIGLRLWRRSDITMPLSLRATGPASPSFLASHRKLDNSGAPRQLDLLAPDEDEVIVDVASCGALTITVPIPSGPTISKTITVGCP